MANRKHTAPATVQPPPSANVIPLVPKRFAELVRAAPSEDTIALLGELLRQADAGELTGLVIVSLHPKQRAGKAFDLSLSGTARTNTTHALAAMDVCHMLLRERALDDSGLSS